MLKTSLVTVTYLGIRKGSVVQSFKRLRAATNVDWTMSAKGWKDHVGQNQTACYWLNVLEQARMRSVSWRLTVKPKWNRKDIYRGTCLSHIHMWFSELTFSTQISLWVCLSPITLHSEQLKKYVFGSRLSTPMPPESEASHVTFLTLFDSEPVEGNMELEDRRRKIDAPAYNKRCS